MVHWQQLTNPNAKITTDNQKALKNIKNHILSHNILIEPRDILQANRLFFQKIKSTSNDLSKEWLQIIYSLTARYLRLEEACIEQTSILFSTCLDPIIYIENNKPLPFPNMGHAKILSLFYTLQQFENHATICLESPFAHIAHYLKGYQKPHPWFAWYLSLISPLNQICSQEFKNHYWNELANPLSKNGNNSIQKYLTEETSNN